MLLRLLRLAIREPALLGEHAGAYADLLKQDAARWQARQVTRAVLGLAAGVGLLLGITFAGVALMIYAATDNGHWLLWVVPALPLAGAIAAGLAARRAPAPLFARVRQQFAEDAELLNPKEPQP